MSKQSKSGWLVTIVDQVIVSLGNFVFVISLSKALSPSHFGLYSLVWMLVVAAGAFVNAWYSSPLTTISPTLGNLDADKFLATLVTEFFALMLILYFLTLLTSWILIENYSALYIDVLLLVAAGISFYIYDFFRKIAILKRKSYSLLIIDTVTFLSLITVCWGLRNAQFVRINAAIFGIFSISAVAMIFTLHHHLSIRNKFWLKRLLHKGVYSRRAEYSKWISFSSIFQIISGAGVVMLSSTLLPLNQIGFLRIAQSLTSIFNPVYVYLDNHIKMEFSAILKTFGQTEMLERYSIFGMIFMISLLTLCISLAVVSGRVVEFIYPESENSEVIYYFRWFILVAFLTGITFILRMRLMILENAKIIFSSYVVAACVSGLVVFPLVYFIGAVGVIQTLALSQITMALLMFSESKRWGSASRATK